MMWLPSFIFITLIYKCCAHEEEEHIITLEDLLPDMDRFSQSGVSTYSQLEFDVDRYQVIVGARDHLFRLNLKDFTLLEKIEWVPSQEVTKLCEYKGQSEQNCHNYIKVIRRQGNRLFVCGTHAFDPQYSWRNIENINEVIDEGSGVGKCPYSPFGDVTSVMLNDGRLYTGTTLDFSSNDPAIVRMLGDSKVLRTKQYNSKWLSSPKFVGSFEMEDFIYFYFKESAVEFMNCGKIIYSRVARVCKDDAGGKHTLRENWTTFRKARLTCASPGEYPFHYDDIQSIFYVPQDQLVYATFTTPVNSIAGSAICVFNMSTIESVFNGPYKYQSSSRSVWERYENQKDSGSCSQVGERNHITSEKYQLMYESVLPRSPTPLYTKELERFTIIAVDVVPTKLHEAVHVLFVATDEGLIKKFSILPRTKEACLLETLNPFPYKQNWTIHTMRVLKDTKSLYIGTDFNVIRVSVERCNKFRTKTECINSMDPYCGWNTEKEECMLAPNNNPLHSDWHQRVTQCPIKSDPVDGNWSRWSTWRMCALWESWKFQLYTATENGGTCSCRERTCDHPKPSNGGQDCVGASIEVTNCTQHGGWTEWSSWSACSATCGGAVKYRRRTCTNPEPRFGGQVCVGPEKEEAVCLPMQPCPVTIHGGWSEWSEWEECSARCGGGTRVRRRECNNPTPQDGGHYCRGCNIEQETCNDHPCQDHHKLTPWTPWLVDNNTQDGLNYQRRYRFSCGAPVRSSDITIDHMKSEVRVCVPGQGCFQHNESVAVNWSEWSQWSDCTVSCGGGYQTRVRECRDGHNKCHGEDKEMRVCGTVVCPDTGYWGPWSNWESCSATCGQGMKRRYRKCIIEQTSYPSSCIGESYQIEPCHLIACEVSGRGWTEWSKWSSCENQLEQYRRRECLVSSPSPDDCLGPRVDTRKCDHDNSVEPLSLRTGSIGSGNQTVGVGLGSFVGGIVVGMVLMFLIIKYRSRRPFEGSRYFTPSKPNEYVCVPTNLNNETKMSTLPRSGAAKQILEMDKMATATVKRTHSSSKGFKSKLNDERYQ